MSRDDLQYIEIQDFTPGIHEIYSSQMPPGTALNTTQGCYASPRHGLTGLPSNDFSYIPNPLSFVEAEIWQIVGFLVIPATTSKDNGDVAYGEGRFLNVSPNTEDSVTAHHSVAMYIAYERVTSTPERLNTLKFLAVVANPTTPPETSIKDTTGTMDVLDTDVSHTHIVYTRNIGDKNGSGARDPTEPGTPVVVASFRGLSDATESISSGYMIMTPDPTDLPNAMSPTTLDFGEGSSVTPPLYDGERILIHQGRILTAVSQFYGRYGDDSVATDDAAPITNDLIYWTESNCANRDFGQPFSDRPYGFGVWESLTASDLFIITHGDGAILVQGDLNAPVVRRFPGVTGTAGLECNGALTPIGFVYGVNGSGIYAWQGADSSKFLSPQLSDQFWVSQSASKHRNHKGTLARWGNWVLIPNGWMLDLDTGGFWRIDNDTRPVINWQVSPSGTHAYGTPASTHYVDADLHMQVAIRGFNKFVKRATWQWDSHPFVVTAHRRVEVREIVLIGKATATSTITITLRSEDGSTLSKAFTVNNSGRVQALRFDCAFQALNLSASIQSSAGDAEIYGLRIGYVLSNTQPGI